MAEEEKKEGEGGEEAAPPKSKKKLIIIVVAAVVLLGGGGGAFMMMSGGAKPEGEVALDEQAPAEKETVYEHAELETFIVNLSENSSFLKVRILLEYDPAILAKYDGSGGAEGAEGGGEGGGHGSGGAAAADAGGLPAVLKKREPMMRDAIIRVLSTKSADDVLSGDGKERLKEELVEAINEAVGLDEGPIVGIYFLEFIVQ